MTWDNLPSHNSKQMAAWIKTRRNWLVVERLPGYAYDINPIEQVWGNVKNVELANQCPDTIDEVHAAESGLDLVGSSFDPCYAFLATPTFPDDHRSLRCRKVFKE